MSQPVDPAEHYENLLAEHYSWMSGLSFEAKVAEQTKLLVDLGLNSCGRGTALDLGSGPGFQSIALANLGFKQTIAIDTSQALLDELSRHIGDLAVETRLADMQDLHLLPGIPSADAVVCMGDTLTHLPTQDAVLKLFADVFATLMPGGLFITTFRDMTAELCDLDRFIPVRSDSGRIMTCVLDYTPDHAIVTDLVHVRDGETWSLRKSSYRKLRLDPLILGRQLRHLGFAVRRNEPRGGFHAVVAQKIV